MPSIAAIAPAVPPQAVAYQDRHVGCIQPRQSLADRQKFDEGLVIKPLMFGHKAVAKVGHHTPAEAGGPDQKKRAE
jgi:hypothetical protein